jgi:hypothetical protein
MSIAFRQQNVIFRFPDPFIIYRYNCSLSVPEVGTIVIHPGQLTHFHKYKPVTSGEVFVLTRYYNTESRQYGTHHSYVLVVHTLRVAENEILKLDFPAKRH